MTKEGIRWVKTTNKGKAKPIQVLPKEGSLWMYRMATLKKGLTPQSGGGVGSSSLTRHFYDI